ncbi:MAG: hypothetical protein HWE26_06555 [Alteromonadaceae bacterium]|nr:hypothetical protein [Alteromonadaceae bacterium]
MTKTPFYLCTGFHRSGTSLVASTLASNNVDMGLDLMGPSFANSHGHFEDIPMVTLHDRILNANATDWRYFDERPLQVSPYFQERMRDYITKRTEATTSPLLIGAKDPRAVFFLKYWDQATDSNLKSLLVYRGWMYSVSSLLKRQSRELLQFTMPIQNRKTDYGFWQYPDLAAQMWLASANAIIAWHKENAHDTLIFEQKAFIHQQSKLKEKAKQKGFEASVLDCRIYDKGLMQTSVPGSMMSMISAPLKHACDEAQDALDSIADVYQNEHIDTSPAHPLVSQLLSENEVTKHDTTLPESLPQTAQLSGLKWNEAMELLKQIPADSTLQIDWGDLLSRESINSSQYDVLYIVAVRFKQWEVAEIALHRAIAIKAAHWRFIHLGDLFMRRKMPEEAKKTYTKAGEIAPENSSYLARLSEVESALGNIEKAQSLIDEAQQLDDTRPAIPQAIKRLELKKKQLAKSSPVHKSTVGEYTMKTVSNYSDVVHQLSLDVKHGMQLDNHMVKSAFVLRDNKKWLAEGIEGLSSSARQCLLDFLLIHCNRYWSSEVLSTELLYTQFNPSNLAGISAENFTPRSDTQTIGVCIHVFHKHLLPELLSFVARLHNIKKIVLTCPDNLAQELGLLFAGHSQVKVIEVVNKGRDILPWLTVAKQFYDCELVLKLHTKATPHASTLCGWRLQMLWLLAGEAHHTEQIFTAFKDHDELGVVMPDYHPRIAPHINWGQNKPLADTLAKDFNLTLPENISLFPAGSMFWYRPDALRSLTDKCWLNSDFPDEQGQTDGTVMHAIERLIGMIAMNEGYKAKFVGQILAGADY